jgi:thiosulfate dehydrogenase [quinone] large subunit
MMAATASTNPKLFASAVGLLFPWKVSGYRGVDYYLLPLVGTPSHGHAVERGEPVTANA